MGQGENEKTKKVLEEGLSLRGSRRLSTEKIISKVSEILKDYGYAVKFAYLFGSYAKGQADDYSDIDIGIYFDQTVHDDIRNEIRFKIYDLLEPYEVDICYLDLEETSPEILLSALEGFPIIINDEESLFEAYRKSVHLLEELKTLER